MNGITITDRDHRNVLTVHLRDILRELGLELYTWTVTYIDAVGGDSLVLFERAANDKRLLSTEELVELSSKVSQIIDGEFIGSCDDSSEQVVIRAVDSSAYDVFAPDDVLNVIRNRFRDVSVIPEAL